MTTNRFFRPGSDASESDSDARSRSSERSGPHGKRKANNNNNNNEEEEALDGHPVDSPREYTHDPWIRQPALPINPTDIPRLIGRDILGTSVPRPLAPSEIEAMLDLAPFLEGSTTPLNHYRQGLFPLFEILLLAIDPATGDSLLHAIVKAGNVVGLDAIVACYPRGMARSILRERTVHVFMAHQNRNGDNAMHLAVRTGDIGMVRAVLRMFCFQHMRHGVDVEDEYPWSVRDGQLQEMSLARPLLLLATQNNDGRSTVEEARACGFTGIGDYLDEYCLRMYPLGMKGDAAHKRRMEEYVCQSYRFLGDQST